jgi:hypothetical protein
MSRKHRPTTALLACLVFSGLALPAGASAAVSVTRAELESGALRVEGRGAMPNATVTVIADSVASRRADGSGAFRIEATGFRAAACRATVGDGATSVDVPLADCTASSPSPTPSPSPEPSPSPTPTPSPTTSSLVIVDDALPSGNVGTAYSGSLYSRGARGDRPVEYRVIAGQLPPGLSMTRSFGVASALITGTPTTVGTSSFTVEASDSTGQRTTKSFSITIDPPAPLVITNQSDQLAPGTVGVGYQIQLFANGGTRPYSWAVAGGQLPIGLSLSGSGLVSGTPAAAGTSLFTARVSDPSGAHAARQFSITIDG